MFRAFWGDKAELRRFKDGSIIEAVVWECDFDQRQNIPRRIAEHLLSYHFSLNHVQYYATQTDGLLSLISPFNTTVSSGDAQCLHITTVFQELADKIRDLEKVPLPVNDVWPVHPVFRSCAVFPPVSNAFLGGPSKTEETLVMEPITFLVQYVNSSSWPDDVFAIHHLKLAFQLKTRSELYRVHQIRSDVRGTSLDITYKGYVFRLIIYLSKEHRLMDKGAKEFKQNTKGLAVHTSSISGFHMKNNAYGSVVRLCKRWLSAHLLSDKIPDPFIELSVLHLFCTPYPYLAAPSVPMFGFLRWLRLIAYYPWATEPLIVSVNDNVMSEQKLLRGRQKMESRTKQFGPFVMSEYDETSLWTKDMPSEMIWKRVVALAKNAVNVRLPSLLSVFVHNYEDYDFVIQLDKKLLPRYWQNITNRVLQKKVVQKNAVWHRGTKKAKKVSDEFLVDFDPVRVFVRELERHFSDIAMFFFDGCGGDKIGGIFRKKRGSFVVCSSPAGNGESALNRAEFFCRVKEMGKGFVKSIKHQ